jgi:hypothetical protein
LSAGDPVQRVAPGRHRKAIFAQQRKLDNRLAALDRELDVIESCEANRKILRRPGWVDPSIIAPAPSITPVSPSERKMIRRPGWLSIRRPIV